MPLRCQVNTGDTVKPPDVWVAGPNLGAVMRFVFFPRTVSNNGERLYRRLAELDFKVCEGSGSFMLSRGKIRPALQREGGVHEKGEKKNKNSIARLPPV